MPVQVLAGPVLPTGGTVTVGTANIQTGAHSVTVNQISSAAIIDWSSFSIGAGNQVSFNNGTGATLSRVTGNITSEIAGSLNATGSLYLVNPAGVVVTSSGQVMTGGTFVASTQNVTDAQFLGRGALEFSGTSTAAIVNNGLISSSTGDVALIARKVENAGTITAPNGTIGLVSGYDVLMSEAAGPDGKFQVKVGGSDTGVINSGTLKAAEIEMRANGGNVLALAGNTKSVIKATGVTTKDGRIFLTAGDTGTVTVAKSARIVARRHTTAVTKIAKTKPNLDGGTITVRAGTINVAGTLDASAKGTKTTGGTISVIAVNDLTATGTLLANGGIEAAGGFVETSGHTVDFTGLAVDTASTNGTTGQWLVDPQDLTVDSASAATIATNLATSNVTLTTTATTATGTGVVTSGNGDITIASAITWSSANTLTLNAYNNIAINAAISAPSGGLTLTATNAISATAGIAVGSYTQTAGNFSQISSSPPTFSATNFTVSGGTFLRAVGGDGTSGNPYQIADVYGLQGIGTSSTLLAANYVLANAIDASGTATWNGGAGFVPIGSTLSSSYQGKFDGAGYTITGLTINRPSSNDVGLFSILGNSGTITNLGLVGGSIIGQLYVGELVGASSGTLSSVYSTGTVSGSAQVGGLVGNASAGSIVHAYTTGTVTGVTYVGGLTGVVSGSNSVVSSYATGVVLGMSYVGGLTGINYGSISTSYASGNVVAASGHQLTDAGGLVGQNNQSIINSYALGNVVGPVLKSAGGLVGDNTGTIRYAYSTGTVATGTNVGGLVGSNSSSGVIASAYWDTTTSGLSTGIGIDATGSATATGLTTSQALTQASYSGLDFTSTWFMVSGSTRPMLRSEYSTTITNAHQLQLMAMNLSASYTLANTIDATKTATTSDIWGTAGFAPVGVIGNAFSGSLNGNGNVINGLTIAAPTSTTYVGLFGDTLNATISNVGLVGGSITGGYYDGALVGRLYATTTASVTNAYANATVTGAYAAGGLIGVVQGAGATSIAINQSYAYGNVTVTGAYGAGGGLIGTTSADVTNAIQITQDYALGMVTGLANTSAGGLIGTAFGNSVIKETYAAAYVTGAGTLGGLIGTNAAGTVSSSYWDKSVSGQFLGTRAGDSTGMTGLTTAQLQGTLPTSFDTSIWSTGTGLYPYFKSQYTTAPIAISGTAYSDFGTTALAGAGITALAGGTTLGTATTGANGYYYMLEASGALTGATGVLAYVSSSGNTGAAFTDSVAGNVAGLNINGAYLTATTSATSYSGLLAKIATTLGSNATATTAVNALGNLDIVATGSSFAIDSAISKGTLVLSSSGTVTQSAAITATNLDVLGTGTYTLTNSGNSVGTLAANTGSLNLTDTAALTIGTVNGVAGITTTGAFTLTGTGTISDPTAAVSVGSFLLAGGNWVQNFATLATFSATSFSVSGGSFLRVLGGDGTSGTPYQIADVYGLQGVGTSSTYLAANWALANNIDASGTATWNTGTGFAPIAGFGGNFDGQNHTIAGLTIYRTHTSNLGLFGSVATGGTIGNVGLVGGSITGYQEVGALVGNLSGTISNSYSTAAVYGQTTVGGLVGQSYLGTITSSYATGAVGANPIYGSGQSFGGLVGVNAGTIANTYATGTMTVSYGAYVGGLVGNNTSTVSNSYATGAVTDPHGTYVAGLIGRNSGTVSNVYSTGATTAPSGTYVGGLVGLDSGTVSNAFWNKTTSGLTNAAGYNSGSTESITGLDTAGMTTLSTFTNAGWSIDDQGGTSSVWRIYGGNTMPLLRSFLTPISVTATNVAKAYDGTPYAGTYTASYSIPSATLLGGLGSNLASTDNAGTYAIGGLYSSQTGYDISMAGTLTINQASLTLT
ncbi:MAG: filamentous hemagglutinin N-terminal domain-containing protein, partial [Ancalomicrobiaceae bacterium]|nr:filamentous hemagglutinin N-terminal domain-containing protein [Ancalomicrobiaceae bacterium]